MLYLLDANVLIRAHEDYYPVDRVPHFWDWLLVQAAAGRIKVPFEIFHEISPSKGPLKDWIGRTDVKEALILDEEVAQSLVSKVLAQGYAPDLTDTELEEVGRDPFLIAYGLMGAERTIVTREISAPGKKRGRRKVPDACHDFGIPWITDFALYRVLDFRITK